MKVVLNLGTPKQVRFFLPLAKALTRGGCETSFVTRDYPEANLLISALGVDAVRLGRYGGVTPIGKLLASAERIALLGRHFDELRPDVVVSLGNHECVRAAFGLGIPAVVFCDLPENVPVACLTLPIATVVCAPACIPAAVFHAAGVMPDRLYVYDALDPLVWLDGLTPDAGHLTTHGLDPDRPLLVSRETEWQSGYVREDIAADATAEIVRRHPDLQVVSIPRYADHPFFDTPSLLAGADLFLGGGGTMCIEAAYFGTPVIATRPLQCHYMDWLFERELAISCTSVEAAVNAAERALSGSDRHRRKTYRVAPAFQGMSFPTDALAAVVMEAGNGTPIPRQRVVPRTDAKALATPSNHGSAST